jgi:hypothetical protein
MFKIELIVRHQINIVWEMQNEASNLVLDSYLKYLVLTKHQWFTPVILASQGRDPSQPRQTVHETLSQKHPTQKNGWQNGSGSRAPV